MTEPSKKLAESLEVFQSLQNRVVIAIGSGDMTRTHRERLVRNGFLQPVMKGWYFPARPDETAGESTAWYASFWDFCAAYLTSRFGKKWSLSLEQSLLLHAGNRRVPDQLLVRASKSRNKVTEFLHGTSLLEVWANLPAEKDTDLQGALRLLSLPAALVACSPNFYRQYATDARTALALIRDASEVLDRLLEGGHSTVAGAFRNIIRDRIADNIIKTMQAAGYTVRESDPFETESPVIFTARNRSLYVNRMRLMWEAMRGPVIEGFPPAPGLPKDAKAYLKTVNDAYVRDAYHSLSIEGYRVSPNLIENVRKGTWNPDANSADREQRDALAACDYWLTFQAVHESLKRILKEENPGDVADEDHGTWYREMFTPGVTAGLLRASDLAGYRNGQVYIRRSMHVPPNREAVRDLMPVFFDLYARKPNPPCGPCWGILRLSISTPTWTETDALAVSL